MKGVVIAAIDRSGISRRVLHHAAGFADLLGARLLVLQAGADDSAEERRSLYEFCLTNLSYQVNLDEEGAIVRSGDAAEAILREAANAPASLVVIGASSRGALASLLLGSTSAAVLRAATTPVLMVPPADIDIVLFSERASLTCGPVLAAIDLAAPSDRQLRLTSLLAELAGQPSLLITVRADDVSDHEAGVQLREHAHGMPAPKPRALIVRAGDVATEISRCALAEGSGLVVMGLRDRQRGRPGAIASAVLKTNRAFVLAVPES